MPFSSQGVCVNDINQLTNSVFAIAHNKCGLTTRSGDQFVTNHQHTVIAAGQITLDHDVFTVAQSNFVSSSQHLAGFDIDSHALALVTVLRFDHHGQTNFLGDCPSVINIFDRSTFWHGQASHTEKFFRQLFVLRNGFGYGAAGVGFSGLNASLFTAPPELHQAAFGQTNVWNVSVQSCIDDGCGRRA